MWCGVGSTEIELGEQIRFHVSVYNNPGLGSLSIWQTEFDIQTFHWEQTCLQRLSRVSRQHVKGPLQTLQAPSVGAIILGSLGHV